MKTRKHRKIVGSSGRGKTNYLSWRILTLADQGDTGIACFFPHRKAGEEVLLHLEERGHIDRVVVHDIRNVESVLPKVIIRISTKPEGYARDAENEEYRDAFLDLTIRRRKDIEELEERPMIEKYSKLALDVYTNLDFTGLWLPPFEIPNILVKDSDVQLWALRNCTHERIREDLRRAAALNGHEQVSHVLPAERHLAGLLNNAVMRASCSVRPIFDAPSHLKECSTGEPGIYVSIGGGSDKATSLHMGNDLSQIAIDARQNPSEQERVTITDETTNYGLYGAADARNQATLRGFNVGQEFATQSYDFPTDAITRGYRQNADSVIFGCDDFEQALECAKDLARGLDEYKVHHTTQTTKQRTKHKEMERVTKGKWSGPDGAGGSSENVSVTLVPEVEEYVELQDQYQQGNEQFLWLAQQIMSLEVGEAIFQLGTGKPFKRMVPYVPPLCAYPEDFQPEAERCLESILTDGPYRRPQVFAMPEQPKPIKPPHAKPPKKPAGNAARVKPRQPKGS